MRLRALPELGHRRLSDVDREDLQKYVDKMLAEGKSAAVIEATINPLRAIYRHAMRSPSSGVAVNPTVGLELPAKRGRRERIAPPDECARLVTALQPQDRALWATAMYAGLRRGELMALRVEDIDMQAGLIHVRHGWDQYDGQITTKSGKTRKVPIASALRVHLAEHLLQLGWREGLVFGTTKADPFSGTSVAFRALSAWGWRRLKDKDTGKLMWVEGRVQVLEPVTLHECRHTFASLMIAACCQNAKALSIV